jgi:hypothetical protein
MALPGGTCEIICRTRSTFAQLPRARVPAVSEAAMVSRPVDFNAYEFVVVAALRAQQLLAGCTPRLEGVHSAPMMAQMEVAAGCVERAGATPATSRQCGWQL